MACTGGLKTECSQCQNNGVADYFLIYGTTDCSLNCPAGQYKDTSGTFLCLLCESSCATCVTSAGNCQTCAFSTLLGADLFLSGTQCLLTCPATFWGNTGTHTCDACHLGCAICTDATLNTCTSCRDNGATKYYK